MGGAIFNPNTKNYYPHRQSFFTPYQNIEDFQAQLKAPIGMFIVCVSLTIVHTLFLLNALAFAALECATFDFDNAVESITQAVDHACDAILFAISAIIDPLWQIAALAARTITTAARIIETVLDDVFDTGARHSPGW